RAADPIAISNAHGVVGQSFDREVLAELSGDEIGSFQLLLPVAIRFDLVDEDGTLFAAMSGEVTLTVSVEVQATYATAPVHRGLPDRCAHSATFPLDVARKSDVY